MDETTFALSLKGENINNKPVENPNDSSSGLSVIGPSLVASVFISPVFLPAMLAGAKSASDSSAINFTFNRNKLQPNTVSPQQDIEGFVYFSIKDKELPIGWNMRVSIKRMLGDKSIDLMFSSDRQGA